MKEQINRYARGAFEYEPLSVRIEPELVIDVVYRNTAEGCYTNIIRITEKNGRELKGLVYSTNNRVSFRQSQFVGAVNIVEYSVDASGVETGDRIAGSIKVVTNGGECDIPYEFEVGAGVFHSPEGDVGNLFQFAALAKNDVGEALKIFASPDFADVFLKGELGLGKLREELLLGSDIKTALEEFLIAVHKKSQVFIGLDREELVLPYFEEDTECRVVVSKNVWGRINLSVYPEGGFVDVDRTKLTEEDFTGGRLEYRFYLRSGRLHAGKNTGRIVFSTPFEKKELLIRVDSPLEGEGRLVRMFEKRSILALMRSYMSYRLHRRGTAEWIAASRAALEELLRNDEDNPYCCLFMSQLLITDNKMNEARFYLDCARDEAVGARGKDTVLYCYYLYVSTLYNRDRTYALETAQTVKEIYERDDNDWRILWILLYFDVEMSKNKSLKLLRIKEQFNKGMRSPVLFLEACRILNEQPLLLRVLNDFEIHVLLYGCKEGIVEERLLKQAAGLAYNSEGRQRLLYRLLTKLYDISEDTDVLEAICGILIRSCMMGEKYLKWYERGIEKGIRVTKLYEYYLASRNMADTSPLPKMVLLYFGYNNELDRRLRAYLYANIIRHRDDNPQIYSNYAVRMEEFVREELHRGTADENTGVVLSEYLKKDMIGRENFSTAADVLFTYKLTVENPEIRNVIVGHKELVGCERYALYGGAAYVRLFTEEPCICFEDGGGRLYKDTVEYRLERIYSNEVMVKQLIPYCGEKLELSLYFYEKSRSYKDKSLDMIRLYGRLAGMEELRPEYRKQLVTQVIDYYFDNYEGDDIKKLLAAQQGDGIFAPERLLEAQRVKLVETLIIYGKYEDAYRLAAGVCFERLNPKRVQRLCEYMLGRFDEDSSRAEPYGMLVELAFYAFSKGRYSDSILDFLILNFNGASEDMLRLWKAGLEKGADVYELEERLAGQLMFCGYRGEELDRVFAHYSTNGPRERVVEAYLAYEAHRYLVRLEPVTDYAFRYIEDRLMAQKDVILLCRLALLKYYSAQEELSQDRLVLAKQLIDGLSQKGYIFSFFTVFGRYFRLPYQLADKTVVEYRTNPEHRVVLHYALEDSGEYTAVDMKNMYAGIFVKPFVLFYGDRLTYYITDEAGEEQEAAKTKVLEYHAPELSYPADRFGLLNGILSTMESGQPDKKEELDARLRTYAQLDAAVEEHFKTIL